MLLKWTASWARQTFNPFCFLCKNYFKSQTMECVYNNTLKNKTIVILTIRKIGYVYEFKFENSHPIFAYFNCYKFVLHFINLILR